MPARVGLVGSGFRARTMLRVLHALPERFEVAGVATRNAADREALATRGLPAAGLPGLPAPAFATLDELLAQRPDFVVVTLPAGAAQPLVHDLAAAGVPVVQETPAAGTAEELVALQRLVTGGACVQVAEQYHLEPLVSAQLAVASSGRLGRVTDVHVSVAHDYHGLSVLRRALGAAFEDVTITARRDERLVAVSPAREGDPADPARLIPTVHSTAWLDYGDRLGVYEFDDQQYRSWVRSPTLVVRGERGEVRDETVRYVRPDGVLVRSVLERVAAGGAGNHEGLFLRGYAFEGGWADRNDLLPARLADDELSVARLFDRMAHHVLGGGPAPYELAEAAQDQHLQLEVRRAASSGSHVRTSAQPWADAPGCPGH